MQFSRQHLEKRRDHTVKELDFGRTLLLFVKIVVGLNGLLICLNLWRGWRGTDYYYVFILIVWVALGVVQLRIQQRKTEELTRLEQALAAR